MTKDSEGDTMSLRINEKGARLPYWLLAAVFGAVVFVVGLAMESRQRLASASTAITKIETQVSKVPVIENRVSAIEKNRANADKEFRDLQRSVIAICVKLGADCPGAP